MTPVSAGSGGNAFKCGFSSAKSSIGCLCVSPCIRTLATVSIEWRAAVFSAFKPGGSCRPLRKFFFARARGPHSTHIVCEDGDSAAISLLGTQSLEDLRGAIGMLLQPALDDWLVRIELVLSPGSEVLAVCLLARPLRK